MLVSMNFFLRILKENWHLFQHLHLKILNKAIVYVEKSFFFLLAFYFYDIFSAIPNVIFFHY